MDTAIKIINMFFGTTAKQRFKRLVIYTIIVSVIIMLIQNLGYNNKDGFSWRPAATITIEEGK